MKHPASRSNELVACRECDWVMTVPPLARGECANCPRCDRRVADRTGVNAVHLVAWSAAALGMLGLALVMPFIHFEARGIDHTIVLLDAATALRERPYAPIAAVIALCVVVLPAAWLLTVAWLNAALAMRRRLPGMHRVARLRHAIEPWIMSDVFVVGVLVSLVKVISLARIELGPSFTAFCLYSVLLLMVLANRNVDALWRWLAEPADAPARVVPGRTAWQQGVVSCAECGALFRQRRACPRCGRPHHWPPQPGQPATWALIITASILYIPAMSWPVMTINRFGHADPQTILGGAWYLVTTGSWPIGLVVFVASVAVPIGKLLALAWLCVRARSAAPGRARERARLYRLTELVGRWSMIDVFVVAVLVALIQAERIVSVAPGPGIIAFGAVVIVTMLAAITFDPRAIWLAARPAGDGSE